MSSTLNKLNGGRRKSALRAGFVAVSAAAALSTSGSFAATGTPISGITGWNVEQIYTGPGSVNAAFDPANNFDYYTTNATGNSNGIGLPANGTITSAASGDTGVTFQLQSFTQSNAFELQSVSGTKVAGPNGTSALLSGTINFTNPVAYSTLSLLDADGNGATTISYTITYNTGSGTTTTSTGSFAGADWFGTGGAILGIGRVQNAVGGGTPTYNTGTDPEIYESDITIPTADQLYPVQSMTFTIPTGSGNGPEWSLFAVSGLSSSKLYVYSAATDPNTFDTTTANFKLNGTTTTFTNGVNSTALFDDTAPSTNGTHTVSVASAGVSPGAVQFNNSSTSYTLNGPGAITGTGSLSVTGGGSVTINNSNTYTGPTSITSGTLNLGTAGSIAASSVTVGAAGTLNLAGSAYSLAGLSGSGSVNSTNGTGANLTFTGSGNYSGSLSLGSGSVTVNSNTATMVLTSGNYYGGGTYLVAGAIDIGNSSALGSGTVYLQGGSLGAVSGPVNLSNFITGGALILPANSSILELSGGSNSFTGPIIIQSGATLQLDTPGAIGGLNPANPSTGFAIVTSGASLSVKDNGGSLGLNGGTPGGAPILLTLTGSGIGGNGALTTPANTSGTWAGNINASGPITIAPGIGSTLVLSGAITSPSSGSGAILYASNKNDSGNSVITLAPPSASSNTYTGESQVAGDYGGTFAALTVGLGSANGFSTASGLNLVAGGTGQASVELNGYNQSVQYLAGGGGNFQISNTAATTSILSISNGNTSAGAAQTFAAPIIGNIAVVKTGSGNQLLSGTNTFTGGTTITQGALTATNLSSLGTGAVRLNGGSLSLLGPAATTYTGFAGFKLNQNSVAVTNSAGSISSDNSTLYLTNLNNNEAVSAYSPTPIAVSTSSNFVVNFTWHNANAGTANDGVYSVADGFAFNIQNSPSGNSALGGNGGGLGYSGTTLSASVQFNTYSGYSSGFGTAFNTNGTQQANNTFTSISPISIQAENIAATLTYSGSAKTLTESLVGLNPNNNNAPDGNTFTTTYNNVDITSILGGSSTAYVGFSGGTGGVSINQWITNYSFQTVALTGPGAISNVVNASGGTTSNIQSPSVLGLSQVSIGALSLLSDPVLGGSIVHVVAAQGSTGRIVLVTPSLSISGSPGAFTSQLDLAGNDLVITGGTLAATTAMLKQGYAAGTWTGKGIASSAAFANTAHLTALGVIINDSGANTGSSTGTPLYGPGGTLSSTFDGATPADGNILVKYTYYGDANLDGAVDGSDYSLIDNAFITNKTAGFAQLTGWGNGDFNYDGVIDGSDYTLIDNAFNQQGGSLGSNPLAQIAAAVGGSAVPEPASLGLLAVGAVGMLGRRRRLGRN